MLMRHSQKKKKNIFFRFVFFFGEYFSSAPFLFRGKAAFVMKIKLNIFQRYVFFFFWLFYFVVFEFLNREDGVGLSCFCF